jgi:hypothetical protein
LQDSKIVCFGSLQGVFNQFLTNLAIAITLFYRVRSIGNMSTATQIIGM